MIIWIIKDYYPKMLSKIENNISIDYTTANHNIKFDITFGEGKDGAIVKNEKERKNFSKKYDVEVFESGSGDDYMKGYRVIANEGPLVVRIGDIRITDENSKYEYALGFALDNNAPEYRYGEYSSIPSNIERDGTIWTIPANDGTNWNFDQNPDAKFQWVTKKALNEGYKPTEEELELGMEESTQNTGLIYLTFMVYKKLKPEPKTVYRGCGTTRGSSAARFGYGNETESASVKSEFVYAEGTEKYILPIRLRIADESETSNINCSQNLRGATLNTLRRQTMTVPF
jgi:hypothetical protein